MSDDKPLDQEQAHFVGKVRRLMMIASATTFIALAVVIGVIGYRVFHWQGSAPQVAPGPPVPNMAATLPAGAKVLATAVGEGRIVLTVDIGGAVELRTFDLNTLKPLGRVRLAPGP
jgi:hypothetical protein